MPIPEYCAYAFIIDRDHIGDVVHERTGLKGYEGMMRGRCPSKDDRDHLAVRLRRDDGTHRFRLYDDGDELYYEGRIVREDEDDDEVLFAPLDWAMDDSGCTRIDYLNADTGQWETL